MRIMVRLMAAAIESKHNEAMSQCMFMDDNLHGGQKTCSFANVSHIMLQV